MSIKYVQFEGLPHTSGMAYRPALLRMIATSYRNETEGDNGLDTILVPVYTMAEAEAMLADLTEALNTAWPERLAAAPEANGGTP